MCLCVYLNKGEFADAGWAACVSDGNLSIMFNPASPTEDVVNARRHLVPFIVITVTTDTHTEI